LTGAKIIRHSIRGNKLEAKHLGETLAEICLQRGAAEILDEARKASEKSVSEVV